MYFGPHQYGVSELVVIYVLDHNIMYCIKMLEHFRSNVGEPKCELTRVVDCLYFAL